MKWDEKAPIGWPEREMMEWAANGPDELGVLAPRGIGKALAVDTPIPTPTGWSKMGDLQVGDIVFDENGKQCNVTAVTDVMHDRPCYRVSFSDHTSIVADAEHLWQVKDRFSGKPNLILTTAQMKDRVLLPSSQGRVGRRYSIQVAKPIECDYADLPIDPYVLGAWLGDGHSQQARMSYHVDEEPHFTAEFGAAGHEWCPRPNRRQGNGCEALVRGLCKQLNKAGLLNNKHIPQQFLRGTIEQRAALLQGIVDTDGHIDKVAGRCEITTVKPALRDGYMELIRSLGFKPTCSTGRATINGRDCGEKYRISFHAPADRPVARMARKASRQRPASKTTLWDSRQIVSIEAVDSVPVKCIQVDSPSHLYLAGEAMVPTHNSHIFSISIPLWLWLNDPDTRVTIASKSGTAASDTVGFIRACINRVPFLRHLKPGRDQKDTSKAFTVGQAMDAKQPSISAFGVDGALEGNRAHVVIADDCENDTNALTYQSRDKLFNRVNEFDALMYRPEPGVVQKIRRRVIYVGTFHAHPSHSLYSRLHHERNVQFKTWPICYPKPKERCINLAPGVAERLAANPALAGTSVFDHRIGMADIAKSFAKGRTYWNRQQMLLLEDENGVDRRLNLGDLMVMDVDPKLAPPHLVYGTRDSDGDTAIDDIATMGIGDERLHRPAFIPKDRIPYKQTVAYIDPAGQGSDEFAISVVGTLAALFYVKLCRGILVSRDFNGDLTAAIRSAVSDAQRLGATRLAYEDNNDAYNALGSSIQQACRELDYKVNVERVHSAGAHKYVRILRLLEPVMSRHRLVVDVASIRPDPALDAQYQLQWQMSHITEDRDCLPHDDRIDSLAGAIGMLADELERDTSRAASSDHQSAIEKQLAAIDREMDRMQGRNRPLPRWMDRSSTTSTRR